MEEDSKAEAQISEEQMEQAVKRGKVFNYLALVLLILLVVGAGGLLVRQQMARVFTTDKWIEHPQERHLIVQDLLNDHPMVGLTRQEVEDLLGPGEARETFSGKLHKEQEGDLWVYSLGVATMDEGWLILYFRDDMVAGAITDLT